MKSVLSFTLIFFFVNSNAWSKTCVYSLDESSIKVSWVGYKFTDKKPVSGSFKTTIVKGLKKNQENLGEILKAASLDVKGMSVESGNAARDINLRKVFFGYMKSKGDIRVSDISISENWLKSTVTMNGKSEKVSFKLIANGNWVEASSVIDILDFSMQTAHKGIHEKCKALHTGKDGKPKTWSEIKVGVKAKLSSVCKG